MTLFDIMKIRDFSLFVVWCLSCFFSISTLHADIATPTQQLKIIRLNGKIEVDCGSDAVFNELYQLIFGTKSRDFAYNLISKKNVSPPGIFFVWNAIDGREQIGSKVVFDQPTIWDLLEEVCKQRKRKLVDLNYGVAFIEVGAQVPARSTIIKGLSSSDEAERILLLFTPSPIQMVDVKNNTETIDFINSQLRKTCELAGSSELFQIVIDGKAEEIEAKKAATFLGYWRYVDLLHIYGAMFHRQFLVSKDQIIMRQP